MTTTDSIETAAPAARWPVLNCRAWKVRRQQRLIRAHINTLIEQRAVVVDTETTDLFGRVIQIAVIDLTSGTTLLDTLVNPCEPIAAAAQAVHGISDADVVAAPAWPDIAGSLWQVLHGRPIVAYNAGYDRDVLVAHAAAYGYPPIVPSSSWVCAMQMRTAFNGDVRNRKLGGNHSALGDCLSARDLLHTMNAQSPHASAV